MEVVATGADADSALIWIGGYLAIWALLLWLSPRFREDLLEGFSLRDPLGLRFWRGHILFAAFSLCYLAVALLALGI
jgi:hypothetical protein